MAPLRPADPLDLDSLLGDEEGMIRDTVRRWVGERILPEIGEWFDEGILPAGAGRRGRRAGPVRDAPGGLRVRGCERDRLRGGLP